MKHGMVMLALALACGGELGDQGDDAELGTAEQSITVKQFYGWNGSTVGAQRQPYRCNQFTGLNTDVCNYPSDKSRKFCVTGTGMTAGQKSEAEADVDSILPTFASQFGSAGWTFSRSCSTPDCSIEYGPITTSQSPTSILGYVTLRPGANTLLSENLPYPGEHRQGNANSTVTLTVDRSQIVADFSVSDQQRVRRHALYGGMYAGGVGLGFTPDTLNNVTSITVTPSVAKSTSVSSQEQCRVNAYDPVANPGGIGASSGCP